jgi:hypothetical protein
MDSYTVVPDGQKGFTVQVLNPAGGGSFVSEFRDKSRGGSMDHGSSSPHGSYAKMVPGHIPRGKAVATVVMFHP